MIGVRNMNHSAEMLLGNQDRHDTLNHRIQVR